MICMHNVPHIWVEDVTSGQGLEFLWTDFCTKGSQTSLSLTCLGIASTSCLFSHTVQFPWLLSELDGLSELSRRRKGLKLTLSCVCISCLGCHPVDHFDKHRHSPSHLAGPALSLFQNKS